MTETIQPEYEFTAGVSRIMEIYKAKTSHAFLLSGNVEDIVEIGQAKRFDVVKALISEFDSFAKFTRRSIPVPKARTTALIATLENLELPGKFGYEEEAKLLAKLANDSGASVLARISKLLKDTVDLKMKNRVLKPLGAAPEPIDPHFWVLIFPRAESIFHESADPRNIDVFLSLVNDESIGDTARFILLTQRVEDINSRLRRDPKLYAVSIGIPTTEERLKWIQNYDASIRRSTKNRPLEINGHQISSIQLSSNYSQEEFAGQTEGLRLREIEDIIIDSWIRNATINSASVLGKISDLHSQKAIKSVS